MSERHAGIVGLTPCIYKWGTRKRSRSLDAKATVSSRFGSEVQGQLQGMGDSLAANTSVLGKGHMPLSLQCRVEFSTRPLGRNKDALCGVSSVHFVFQLF